MRRQLGFTFIKPDSTDEYLRQVVQIVEGINRQAIDALVELLVRVRQVGGRLFILGVGGALVMQGTR